MLITNVQDYRHVKWASDGSLDGYSHAAAVAELAALSRRVGAVLGLQGGGRRVRRARPGAGQPAGHHAGQRLRYRALHALLQAGKNRSVYLERSCARTYFILSKRDLSRGGVAV